MTSSFDKGAAVEEWTDRRFFRPLGLRVARALFGTRISPDQVTLASLLIGLVAGRLAFYPSAAVNGLGVLLFIVSDILDSADGQLARMRGTSTRFGRFLDGLSDNLRFINLYLQLMARVILGGGSWWLVIPLGFAAGLAHGMQSTVADFVRQAYLHLAEGRGEFDLVEDVVPHPQASWATRLGAVTYRRYLRRQARLFPDTVALVRQLRNHPDGGQIAARWPVLQGGVVGAAAWIGQNIRFLLLAVTVIPGQPMLFFWITLVPLSGVALLLANVHERHVRSLRPDSLPALVAA